MTRALSCTQLTKYTILTNLITIVQSYEFIGRYANKIDVHGDFIDECGHCRTGHATAGQYHEKHRAVARDTRPGVYGGSAPDCAHLIKICV